MYGMPKNSEDSRRTIAQVFPGFPTLMEESHLSSSSQSLWKKLAKQSRLIKKMTTETYISSFYDSKFGGDF